VDDDADGELRVLQGLDDHGVQRLPARACLTPELSIEDRWNATDRILNARHAYSIGDHSRQAFFGVYIRSSSSRSALPRPGQIGFDWERATVVSFEAGRRDWRDLLDSARPEYDPRYRIDAYQPVGW
jgi:hypothetical protein